VGDNLYSIGRSRDPLGGGDVGHHSQISLEDTAFEKPIILYRDKLGNERPMQCELYLENDEVWLHMLCPLCSHPEKGINHALKVSDKRKALRVEDGKVYCEPIRCPWEEDETLRRSHGLAQCTWHVRIDANIATDV
jgi:hypothetical protein